VNSPARRGSSPRAAGHCYRMLGSLPDAERDLLKKYVEASEAADFRAFEAIIRTDATFRMPPQPGTAAGLEDVRTQRGSQPSSTARS
jgi:hypothetical protein